MSSLYIDHFGLREPPFGITPNGKFFFDGRTRGAILQALHHAVLDEDGIIVVVGEVGSGKTMLCRKLAEELPRSRVDLVYLSNPAFGPQEILHSIVADWGLTLPPGRPVLLGIQDALMQRHASGRRVVLLIDEAQAMPADSLEEIKLLSNFETAQRKLLQIVLFGQPELDTLIGRYDLRQVRDRIAHRFELQPLDESSAHAYIEHRLRKAGWVGNRLFDPQALRHLLKDAGGRMRMLSQLADRALVAAYADSAASVSVRHVQRARDDAMAGRRLSGGRKAAVRLARRGLAIAAVAGAAAAAAGVTWQLAQPSSPWRERPGWLPRLAGLGAPLVPDALLAQAPPATGQAPAAIRVSEPAPTAPMPASTEAAAQPAATPEATPEFTVQLVSLSTQEAAKAEARRLAEILPNEEFELVARHSSLAPHAAPMWTVCVGRFKTLDEARMARDRLPASLSALQPLVRKVGA